MTVNLFFGLIYTFLCLQPVRSQDLEIIPEGDMHKVAEGKNIVLTCQVNHLQDAKLKWFDQTMEQIIETNGRIYITQDDIDTLKLTIKEIQNMDGGTYTCEGVVEGSVQRKEVTLEIYKDITFDKAPSPQNPVEFTDALIQCEVSGNPTPEVSWRYRGQSISTGGRYQIDALYGLRISNITEEDNGLYECVAEVLSTGASDTAYIEVVVHKPPVFTKELGTTVGIEGQEVSMVCKATGLPDPHYEFYRLLDSGQRSRVSSTDTRFVDEQAGTIDYRPLYRDDQDEYECEALNSAGHIISQGYLDVIIPPKIYQYFNMTQKIDNSVTLTCLSEGEPPPDMAFRKVTNDYDYVDGENEEGRVVVRSPSPGRIELSIEQLLPRDTANYTCKATNQGGFAEQNGTIIVEFAPLYPQQERLFYGWPGKTRNVTCHTYAEPAPVIEWVVRDRVLENNETYRIVPLIKNSVLQIYPREQDRLWIYHDDYNCRARNQHGENSLMFTFLEATQPEPPEEVVVLEEAPTVLILGITPPTDDGGAPVIGYRVEYDTNHMDFTMLEEVRIENLRPQNSYLFNVRARNEVDVSNPYQLSHTTPQIRIPYPIVIISDPEGWYPYDYTLLWEKPLTGGTPIREYKFRYRRVRVVDGTWEIAAALESWSVRYKEDNPDNPMSSYRLEGLSPATHYQVEITARNDIGWSDPSSQFVFMTESGDSPVQSTAHIQTYSLLLLLSVPCTVITSKLIT